MDRAALDSLDRDELMGVILRQFEAIDRLTAENADLRVKVAQLQAKLDQPAKTPDNSSLPPSLGRKASSATQGEAERQAHAGAHRPLHPDPTHRREAFASSCPHCGADVSQSPQSACQTYDRIEIPDIKPDVTRVTLHGGVCPCCAKRFKAEPPDGLEPGSPFGPNLRAFILYLRFTQGVGFERLSRLLFDLIGLEISEGALVNILKASVEPFAAASEAIRARLLAGEAICSDETGLRVGKRSWWLWVFHYDDSAFFMAHARRGKMAVAHFLGAARPDFWVSDRYGSQMGWAKKDHQVCLAHLIRDIQYVIDQGDDVFAPPLRDLIARACAIGRRRPKLVDASLKIYAAKLEADLDHLLALTPANAAGVKLQGVIEKFRRHLFVFMTNRAIPPTNNESERALRPCVTFRKITNGFRSQWGARLYADIRSVIETARRRALGPLQAIRSALEGKCLPLRALTQGP
jgi:transposase